jgi:hypothetical protein
MMAVSWAKPTWGKPVVLYVVVALVAFQVFSYLSPKFARSSREVAREYLGFGEHTMVLAAKEREEARIDGEYLKRLVAEQVAMRKMAVERCGGQICKEHAAIYTANETRIKVVEAGTYLEPPPPPAKREEAAAPEAPPPEVARPAPAARRHKARKRNSDVWTSLNEVRPL